MHSLINCSHFFSSDSCLLLHRQCQNKLYHVYRLALDTVAECHASYSIRHPNKSDRTLSIIFCLIDPPQFQFQSSIDAL